MVKVEQRLKINEEIVREHLATFSDLKPGERPESEPHSRLPREGDRPPWPRLLLTGRRAGSPQAKTWCLVLLKKHAQQ